MSRVELRLIRGRLQPFSRLLTRRSVRTGNAEAAGQLSVERHLVATRLGSRGEWVLFKNQPQKSTQKLDRQQTEREMDRATIRRENRPRGSHMEVIGRGRGGPHEGGRARREARSCCDAGAGDGVRQVGTSRGWKAQAAEDGPTNSCHIRRHSSACQISR